MITVRKLNDAIKEAVRFIKVAEKCKEALGHNDLPNSCPKETGSTRRASMDITRELALLRKRN